MSESLIRHYIEDGFNARNPAVADEVFSNDHQSRTWGAGPDGIRQREQALLDAFPDARYRIDEVVDGDNVVVVRATLSGTHRGNLRGISPTGKKIEFESITI